MPYSLHPSSKNFNAPSFNILYKPVIDILETLTPLKSRGNRPIKFGFNDQLKSLVFFHLEEYTSGRHLLQALKEDGFACNEIAPAEGIEQSSFFEAINDRGLLQLMEVFYALQGRATKLLPSKYENLGELIAIDGSLIDAVLSMYWADYRDDSKKAKVHIGFDLNRGIPKVIFLTNGKADERPFVNKIVAPGQTGVTDRGYQCYQNFDLWQEEGKHFVCRIKDNATKIIIRENEIKAESIVFYDKIVLLGTEKVNQTVKEVRLVGYKADGKVFWVATDRFDLSAENIALIYRLRWNIETFFGWWKRHLKVYHLIARSEHGLMVQVLAGLITYILLAIYCYEQHKEKVSIKRVRELRIKIKNESSSTRYSIRMWIIMCLLTMNYLYAKS
jgi:hypothetical protein